MITPGSTNPLLATADAGGYQIQRSLRFNSADSAYLNRTPGSAGNRRTWTWSAWIKRSALSTGYILDAGTGPNTGLLIGGASDVLSFFDYTSGPTYNFELITTQSFRDVSAWYHIVVAVDTTQATSSNRVKIYLNGSQITAFGTATYPSQNFDTGWNNATAHRIGSTVGGASYFNGYLTNINFIDGQALTPSSFGETNADTGVWQPKAYSGTYGTNGFQLLFADNSGTTSTTLGKDTSGNGNNWTPNNFSVTAGAGNDSLVDTPTPYGTDTGAGGEVRGNYATLNPLSKSSSITLANGNLDASTAGGGAWGSSVSTLGLSSGKWYFEAVWVSGAAGPFVGYTSSSADINTYLGGVSGSAGYLSNATKYVNGSVSSYGASYTTGDVIGVAVDMDAGTITCYKNNSSQGTLVSGLTGTIFVGVSSTNGTGLTVNFGQRPFAYTAPSGFKALCTQNLPTPTIGATSATQAGKYFNTVIWTGNGTSQSITGVGFQPDFIWIKERSAARTHCLTDAVRGFTKYLFSDATNAEETYSTLVTSADSNGFSLGSSIAVNDSNQTYVGWNWKANGTGSSNTAGSITSTVSANTTAGFSIVTYTGTGANATVGHGLGVAPSMIIVKSRSATGDWTIFHSSLQTGRTLYFDTSAQSATGWWNNTAPTSTLFSLSGTGYTQNNNGTTYVAYCFAPVAGYSAFGSYTGNGSSDGTFVYTGFRPRYVMLKASDRVEAWYLFDTARNTYNVADNRLYANTSGAEGTGGSYGPDILSNGFKLRTSDSGFNFSGATYIYAAFAEVPTKFSLAR